MPVVNLHLADEWKSANDGRRVYGAVHTLFGLVLIPLFLARITGLLKKQEKGE